jgi:hypothetical protein
MDFYGGIGAEIDEEFLLTEMKKEQTLVFASTDPRNQIGNLTMSANLRNESPVHLVAAETKNAFNGTWGMESSGMRFYKGYCESADIHREIRGRKDHQIP